MSGKTVHLKDFLGVHFNYASLWHEIKNWRVDRYSFFSTLFLSQQEATQSQSATGNGIKNSSYIDLYETSDRLSPAPAWVCIHAIKTKTFKKSTSVFWIIIFIIEYKCMQNKIIFWGRKGAFWWHKSCLSMFEVSPDSEFCVSFFFSSTPTLLLMSTLCRLPTLHLNKDVCPPI